MHINLFLTHQKLDNLVEDCLFQSIFDDLNSCYSDYKAIYTDRSKTEENKWITASATDGLSAQVKLPSSASIFKS